MINWIIGASGGGKSYEAVRYQILPALERGRHVITNLPLNLEEFEKLDPSYLKQIHIRKAPQPIKGIFHLVVDTPVFDLYTDGLEQQPERGKRVFSGVWDYYFTDDYRTEKGQGPLFVIDECHFALPYKNTHIEVEDWFSVHRHYNCDVLLLTQSYGKVSQAIRDNTQIVYRVRKNIAFGSKDSYTKKVQDGFRGEVVNTSIRQYDSKYFPLYKSHTQGESVEEFGAEDITPLWMRWPFIGTALCLVAFIWILAANDLKNPFTPSGHIKEANATDLTDPQNNLAFYTDDPTPQISTIKTTEPPQTTLEPQHTTPDQQSQDIGAKHPLIGKGVHIIGRIQGTFNGVKKDTWRFSVSQNAQKAFEVNLDELKAMGYQFNGISDCLANLTYQDFQKLITCDAPSHQVPIGGSTQS